LIQPRRRLLCAVLASLAAGAAARPGHAAPPSGALAPLPAAPGQAATGTPILWSLQPPVVLSEAQVAAEVKNLRAALLRDVPRATVFTPQRRALWVALAHAQVAGSDVLHIDRPQLLVVVDRNEAVEELALILARPEAPGGTFWDVIGGVKVSTGQPGRFDHYITPTGVFLHNADILDYRAEGTFNENGIRGLGVKGMRVWDFGWQWATKGWRPDGERGQIRLEMHATDPDMLAQRIGRAASQGCIRIPDAMNRFLDRHGVLDADYEHAATDDIRYRALLLPDRTPTALAGDAMVVVDSGGRVR
jgi:hypothetical protein